MSDVCITCLNFIKNGEYTQCENNHNLCEVCFLNNSCWECELMFLHSDLPEIYLVTGSSVYYNRNKIRKYIENLPVNSIIITVKSKGVSTIAHNFAIKRGMFTIMLPDISMLNQIKITSLVIFDKSSEFVNFVNSGTKIIFK